ncbi:ADP-ribosylation factor-related protein 1-like [Varroa jacobsoni]|uniref:ADP-ribosylation factor-like protein 6 n=1 Tax=Varroa destructor TaxID=109461 RepID=A0A7M7K5T6_VARDE|nr:ADP-ribosylation factor-related protein 1-like [Varroa destructor]XP_022658077.1 ADP-ribosylation factor-related protein 1-like [Varroa destructor]XP_022658078.1 ADP-ribosylation factor-related protein 1-like [Varroa destructor]XP_022658079.1 ADP-ribosylation factor-related protein 1-like [Varroa destructor]XP_022658080.1 ADP-ribosylation factor-related protein 1-like [Varroa destructor]XP_022704983.1 ADP-ribosylation factor-related protein 1-like [Varroa jacobsoni]XP_022704984.1 ADP-ribos
MYTLLHGLWKYITQKEEYSVLILGLDNAGKTTYLEQTKTKFTKGYTGLRPNKLTTTVGLNIGKIDTQGVRINFWDLGGQESLQALWDKYYSESHSIIYVVDSSCRERLQESRRSFEKMIDNDALFGVPLLIIANKQDIAEAATVTEIRQLFRECNISNREMHIVGASALHGEGIQDGITWLVDGMKRNLRRPPRNVDT